MEIIERPIPGLFLLKPKVFGDSRGYFYESFSQTEFNTLIGEETTFVQDNQSLSQKNVLRGLHFQVPPHAQGKLVRVVRGAVLDVVVDLRKNSPFYGKHYSVELTEKNHLQLYIPAGFAHGFLTLQDQTIFTYKCTQYYNKESEDVILWNDPSLSINWKVDAPMISEKDEQGKTFKSFESPF